MKIDRRSHEAAFVRAVPVVRVRRIAGESEGMTDFITVHSSHTWLAWRSEVISQILAFLHSGRFRRPAPRPQPR